MLNQVIIVGRLVKDVELRKTENGNKIATLTLAVPRSFKNSNGEYDTDFIYCTLFSTVAENTSEYCKKGDIVGVKGRVESNKEHKMNIVAEKVTFLSSSHNKEENKKEETPF